MRSLRAGGGIGRGREHWSPNNPLFAQVLAMFANGEQGWFYDYSNLSTLFQDSAGTIPVTAVGQPVGRVLDLSGRGNHKIQATAVKRPTLAGTAGTLGTELIQNGDFGSATGWTAGAGWAIGSGVATGTTASTALSQAVSLADGKTYQLTLTVTRTAGSFGPRFVGGTTVFAPTISAAGTYTFLMRAETGNVTLDFVGTGFSGTIGNVTLKEVLSWTAPYGLLYDGVDDAMLTSASVDLSGTDSITVTSAARKFTDAAVALLSEFSASSTVNNGTFAVFAPSSTGGASVSYRSRGTATSITGRLDISAPVSFIVQGSSDISADSLNVLVNGVSFSSSSDQGTGNYGNHVAYFGSRGGTSSYFSGLTFLETVIARPLNEAEALILRQLASARSGVAI